MFEIGFWELVLVVVVALLVVGPERLPKLAYEVGLWYGRMQRYLRSAQFQLENELHNYEIKNSLQEPTRLLEDIRSEIDQSTHDPWKSPHFTGGPPALPVNPPPNEHNPEVKSPQENAAVNNPAGSAVTKTESSTDDGKTKP